jgi:hypothetical protein
MLPCTVAAQNHRELTEAENEAAEQAYTGSTMEGTTRLLPLRNEAAVEQGHVALEAFHLRQWERAYREFQRAEALAHSPVFVLYMARAKRQLGQFLAADTLYEKAEAEPLSAATVDSWRLAQNDASLERAELAAQIPSVRIIVRPESTVPTTITIDGVTIDTAGKETPLDPGEHAIGVQREGFLPAIRSVVLSAGEKNSKVQLDLVPLVPKQVDLPEEQAARTPSQVPHQPSTPVVAYVTGAIGLASLAVTAVVGAWAFTEASSLKENCDGNRCARQDAAKAASIRRLATISDATLVVGIEGLGLSATLFWLPPDDEPSSRVRGLRVTAYY